MRITKTHIIYGILLLIFLVSAFPWTKEGVPVTDDYRHHAARISFIQEEIKNLEFSEWNPHMYGGWPFFHFYHPMFYILALPFALIFETIATLKVMTIVAFAIALFGTFYAARLLFDNDEVALIAAVCYFMSSHFFFQATVAGALPRLTAIALSPLVAALFIKAIETKNKKYYLTSGISLAILFMTHTSVSVPVFVLCGIYLLYELYLSKDVKLFYKGIALFLIALGLSAFWIIPLLAEKDYANLQDYSGLGSPHLKESSRFFGIINDNGEYIRSNYFGYTTLALGLLAVFLVRKDKKVNFFKIGAVISVLLYFNIFGILNHVPLLATSLSGNTSYFISMVVFCFAVLAGIGAKSLARKMNNKYLLYIILFFIIIDLYPAINAFSYTWTNQPTENFVNPPQLIDAWRFVGSQPGDFSVFSLVGQAAEIYHQKQEFGFDWVGCPQCVQKATYDLHTALWTNFTHGIKNDELLGYLGVKYYVLPCQYKLDNKLAYSNNAVCVYENEKFRPIIDSSAKIYDVKKDLDSVQFTADAVNESDVLVKINYFKPHWHSYVNGKEVQIIQAFPEFMMIKVPAGINSVLFEYKTNSTHIISWLITIMTIALMVYFYRK